MEAHSIENQDFPLFFSLLTDPSAFVEHVVNISPNYNTYQQAYEATEELLEERVGRRRYASYQSFKVVKHRVQSRAKKNLGVVK